MKDLNITVMFPYPSGKYYLYRHIRLDKNKPFYIGIGTKPENCNTLKCEYKRAYQKYGKKRHWKNIVNITDYEVEILLESNDYKFIKQKEIEFIALYKRVDCCGGTLVNMTDGGEGTLNMKGKDHPKSIKVYQYSIGGDFIKEWESINIASNFLNINTTNVVRCLKGKLKSTKNYRWSYECVQKLEPMLRLSGFNQKTKKRVVQIDIETNEKIRYFESISEASIYINGCSGKISMCCNNLKKTYKNYKWNFYEKTP